MLLAARYVANSIRVFSVVGTGMCPVDLQKWWNFCCPAAYVCLVEGASPSVKRLLAKLSRLVMVAADLGSLTCWPTGRAHNGINMHLWFVCLEALVTIINQPFL